jgi:hypothetical protein
MERWVHEKNIERRPQPLQAETLPTRRMMLERILEDERRQLVRLQRDAPKPS